MLWQKCVYGCKLKKPNAWTTILQFLWKQKKCTQTRELHTNVCALQI